MLNRNATRHLLLVASILLCAFIYAGYSLATRGDAPPGETAPATDAPVTALRPPPSPPQAAPATDASSITGLVPAAVLADDEEDSPAPGSGSGLAPGTSLPLPGFSATAPLADTSGAAEQPPPVLTLPGMGGGSTAAANNEEEDFASFGDEDFGDGFGAAYGNGESGEVLEEDGGDFAALPGFGAPAAATPSAAPASPATAPSFVPPPAATAPGTGAALRPPPGGAAGAPGAMPGATSAAADMASFAPPPPPTTPPARTPLPASAAPAIPPRTALPVPAGLGGTAGMPGMTPPPAATTTPDPEPRSDSLRIYVVAPGDTLSSIAMRELGSGFLADNIFLLNRDVIDDPNHLMAGVKIRLPYANPGLSADPSDPALSGGSGAGGDGTLPRRSPNVGLGNTHTVARGDTLSSIAQQYYGSSALWRFLHEANKTVIPNPNQLTVGTELNIPPYEE